MTNDAEVLIAGAGPTGLTLALWLTKLGIRIRIIDQRDAPAPYSRALGVQPRTLELYRQLGNLGDEVAQRGLKVQGLNFWTSGRRAAHVPFANIGEGLTPYPFVLTFAQDEHERLLIERLAALGVTVERSTKLVGFTQDANGVDVETENAATSQRSSARVAFIAGCDGAHSTVRETIGAGFSGGTYSRLFYVADVDASGRPIDRDIHIELDEADLLALFPMDGRGRVRLVGTIRDDAAERGRDLRFEDVSHRAIERLHLDIARVNWFSTYRVHHRVASRFRDRRAFLLGDAAHVHSPVGAQGMNTGIGDSVNLAWKLAAVLRGEAHESLLDTYDSERRAFAQRLVKTTDRIFTIASKPGGFARIVRRSVIPIVMPLALRVGPMRRFLFRTVSQLVINYRHSAISRGRAGAIQGGDRLPWVPDNFAFVSDVRWQAHVYGAASDDVRRACAELDLPLHVFPYNDATKRAGFATNAIYVIRPDSYVGFAGTSVDAMRAYCAAWKSSTAD
ncbi:MAG TPA: FAD-dependent monooxygenase [Thermoanaerobaculia bacterium]|nr:FAD-dependent monooxygenase [Thermoanaerobaculia bacterium]